MLCFAVDVLQKRKQFVLEFGVIVRTTESSLAAELTETDPAVGAGGLVEFLECLVTGELDGNLRRGVRWFGGLGVFGGFREVEILLVTRFAEMQFVHSTLAHLGDVQRGRLRATAAFLHSTDGRAIGGGETHQQGCAPLILALPLPPSSDVLPKGPTASMEIDPDRFD